MFYTILACADGDSLRNKKFRRNPQALQIANRTADHRPMRLLLVILGLAAVASASDPRTLPRSEPRDQARTQRHTARYCTTCERDARGRILRNPAARRAFVTTHPCPATGAPAGPCPGYVVDHIVPLKNGGADDPSNMQWQTTAEAKAKDRTE
jgi:hypothetical protein